ncbi:MAG TPA: bifunctional diaminohydroxyphosphoribosylaminopyrimidine deaminase/5-amino-6-(5-phosphoribosylamino)uracil reductase RibD [Candidatus Alectryocaccobium stercorigallinarum]|nr:bifunctional diaminohydroxyphosphoribosylaminopyrimidine deaminase/5-amino-6-(5-phosphoribosylamino)uracil reductase RibD [Candidatus Alectryocaccobium stercorigallinarum]
MTDRDYMLRAIELAKLGTGAVDPNPLVGAVIVKDGKIIGEGYHAKYGDLHAERNAIKNLTESAEGATIYVTLEPCCHHGKQPPCTDAILENKISRVVIGSRDPNPLVSGKGAAILRTAGVTVEEDFMRDECDAINPVFFHYITTKTPYVVMKYAMTADGKIATKTGASKWITGEEARECVQAMRYTYTGIMAGIGTVLADDPMLNVRIDGKRSPVRIICDSSLRIPADCKIVQTASKYRTIIACALTGSEALFNHEFSGKIKFLESRGIEILYVPDSGKKVDLKTLMTILGSRGINSILLEGGGALNYSALKCGIVNEIKAFIAPKIFGGKGAASPVSGDGVSLPSEAYGLQLTGTDMFGEDILLNYKLLK